MKDEVVSIGKQHFLQHIRTQNSELRTQNNNFTLLSYMYVCMHSANKILAIVAYYEKYNNITSY